MIAITYSTDVELDLAYADTSDVECNISGGYAEYGGSVTEQNYDVDFEITACDLVGQLCEHEIAELRRELKIGTNIEETPVDSIYESMDAGQRAHMFNKLLKHEDYNAGAVALNRVSILLAHIAAARNI